MPHSKPAPGRRLPLHWKMLIGFLAGLALGLSVGTDEHGGPSIFLEAGLTAGFAVPWLVAAISFRAAGKGAAVH